MQDGCELDFVLWLPGGGTGAAAHGAARAKDHTNCAFLARLSTEHARSRCTQLPLAGNCGG